MKVTKARCKQRKAEKSNPILVISCEVLVPGRYLQDFALSNEKVGISVEDDLVDSWVDVATAIRVDTGYALQNNLWKTAKNKVTKSYFEKFMRGI